MISEEAAQSKIFLYEPDLVQKCADMLILDHNIPYVSDILIKTVQTAALYVLDSIGHYRSKQNEVSVAVNAGVNHGVLMFALQNVMRYLQDLHPVVEIPLEYIDALFALVSFLSSQGSNLHLINSAGLIPILVGIIENYRVSQRKVCIF